MPRSLEGRVLGHFTLKRRIGTGGNCDVWLARRIAGEQVALKFSRGTQQTAQARLANEIEILRRIAGEPGVVPLLDSGTDPEIGHWYAMPRLAALKTAYPDVLPLERALRIGLRVAGALAKLAAAGIHHRDLKPNNLLADRGEPLVADFGLAAFPNQRSLTAPGTKLGPLHFLAPEMLEVEGGVEDYGPADVYSLAKTLWVIATEATYPPPGEQRVDITSISLRGYFAGDRRADALDALIEACTRIDPRERPSMAGVSAELAAILNPKQWSPMQPENLSDIRARMDLVQRPALDRANTVARYRPIVGSLRQELSELLDPIRSTMTSVLPGVEIHLNALGAFLEPTGPVPAGELGGGVIWVGRRGGVVIELGVAFEIDLAGRMTASARASVLLGQASQPTTVVAYRWETHAEPVLVEAERPPSVFSDLAEALNQNLRATLEAFVAAVEQEG
jgi:serine/threonine protein kinase